MNTEQEIQVLTDEAQMAITEADRLSERLIGVEQENLELKKKLNRIVHLTEDEDEFSANNVLSIIYGS